MLVSLGELCSVPIRKGDVEDSLGDKGLSYIVSHSRKY